MRYGFLLILLIGVAIALYLWSKDVSTKMPLMKQGDIDARQIAGRGNDGAPATDAISVDPVNDASGKFTGVKITAIDATGVLPLFWGLQVNDVIVGAEGMKFTDIGMDDTKSVKDWILRTYQAQQALDLIRNGQRIRLEGNPNHPGAVPFGQGTTASPTATPSNPTATPAPAPARPPQAPASPFDQVNKLKDQVETVPTH